VFDETFWRVYLPVAVPFPECHHHDATGVSTLGLSLLIGRAGIERNKPLSLHIQVRSRSWRTDARAKSFKTRQTSSGTGRPKTGRSRV